MYQEFFSLKHPPFLISPSPDFLFFTEQHKEALAHLTYGLQGNGGFVVLTGEMGTGKTSICQYLLQDMPADTDIASITNTTVSEISLLTEICNQLSIEYDQHNISLKVMFDALSSWMLKNHQLGRHAIVLIDEAQHLSFSALEQLRLLTNIEANNLKPLQIILVGQTELQQKLLNTELRQLSQRITARYHLRALNKQETNFYIHHRLNLSGATGPIFDPKSIAIIFKASQGIPLLINQICDRCLLNAYTQSWLTVPPRIAKKTIKEAELPQASSIFKPFIPHTIVITSVILLAFFVNQQAPMIGDYFEEPEENTDQQEWLRLIKTASDQKKSKVKEVKTSKKLENIAEIESFEKEEKQPPLEVVMNTSDNIIQIPKIGTVEESIPNKVTKTSEVKKLKTLKLALTSPETLLAISSNSYSLQLAALPNEKSVQTFFIRYPALEESTYLYKGRSESYEKYVILFGTFDSYKKAKVASKALNERFPTIDPWIKHYKTIHDDII